LTPALDPPVILLCETFVQLRLFFLIPSPSFVIPFGVESLFQKSNSHLHPQRQRPNLRMPGPVTPLFAFRFSPFRRSGRSFAPLCPMRAGLFSPFFQLFPFSSLADNDDSPLGRLIFSPTQLFLRLPMRPPPPFVFF